MSPTACSLLNDVLGPEMRGPSSSHAAAPYAIARTCRELSLSPDARLRCTARGGLAVTPTALRLKGVAVGREG